jgi:hypothetical protein
METSNPKTEISHEYTENKERFTTFVQRIIESLVIFPLLLYNMLNNKSFSLQSTRSIITNLAAISKNIHRHGQKLDLR